MLSGRNGSQTIVKQLSNGSQTIVGARPGSGNLLASHRGEFAGSTIRRGIGPQIINLEFSAPPPRLSRMPPSGIQGLHCFREVGLRKKNADKAKEGLQIYLPERVGKYR